MLAIFRFPRQSTALLISSLSIVFLGLRPAQAEVSQIVFTGPLQIGAGSCTAYQVVLLNNQNFPTPAPSSTTAFTFSLQGPGTFYKDECVTKTTSISFSAGQVQKDLYYKNSQTEIAALSVGDASGQSAILGTTLQVLVGTISLGSLQTLAQETLGGVWAVETAFFADYGEYSTFLVPMGFNQPGFLAAQYYRFGFSSPATLSASTLAAFPLANQGPIHTEFWLPKFVALQFPLPPVNLTSSSNFQQAASSACPQGVCTANTTSFTAIAFGASGTPAAGDVWLINQEHQLVHVR